jgi:hypothetical protein
MVNLLRALGSLVVAFSGGPKKATPTKGYPIRCINNYLFKTALASILKMKATTRPWPGFQYFSHQKQWITNQDEPSFS